MVISFILRTLLVLKRIFLVPAAKLLFLPFPHSFIGRRAAFEERIDFASCNSFYIDRIKAFALFHVSSEGELEQVYPLIEKFLQQGKKIELVFTSDSVEKKCHQLAQNYDGLRILPLPLLGTMATFHVEDWATSRTLIMCRYDFFPELLYFATLCDRCYLVGASVKKYQQKLKAPFSLTTFYWKMIFAFFHYIVPSTENDEQIIKKLAKSSKLLAPLDMRTLRIGQRLEGASHKLERRLSRQLMDYISQQKQSVIIGSCWEAEMEILKHPAVLEKLRRGELLIYVAPHRLDNEFRELFEKSIVSLISQIPVAFIDRESSAEQISKLITDQRPLIIYSQVPGVLCELYSLFDVALVGGGWGRSVHSVLEPYLAGCSVVCGPKVFRSTEVDIIQERESEYLAVLDTPLEINESLEKFKQQKNSHREISLIAHTTERFDQLAHLIQSSSDE